MWITFSQFVLTLIGGLVLGILSSLFAWWILFRWLSPSIHISEKISKSLAPGTLMDERDKAESVYKFKFYNSGSRVIVDIEVTAYFRIKGFFKKGSGFWEVVRVPLAADRATTRKITHMTPFKKSEQMTVYKFYVSDLEHLTRSTRYPELKSMFANATIDLTNIFQMGDECELRVVFMGYDEFSGARKMSSRTYRVEDIVDGEFTPKSMDISAKQA